MKRSKIILFVEGDTDEVFFKALLGYYREHSSSGMAPCDVVNLNGVTRYTSKISGKLRNGIIPMAEKDGYEVKAVCCSYDTDVFEFAERPAVDWKKVEREVKSLRIEEFCRIEVKEMIEDWILDDMRGLCSYLNIRNIPSSLKGKNAYDRIQNLFRSGHKVYLKGTSAKQFISSLDMAAVRQKRRAALEEFERLLGIKIKE